MGGEKQDFQETVLMRWESSSSSSMESLSEEEEESSSCSNSLSDISDDATSSSSSSSSANSNDHGPLYKLSDLMTQLPIKRGLSKFYDGKSQTFASLDSVMSIEDLSKATTGRRRRRRRNGNGNRKMIKYCKSYAGGLELDSSNSNSCHKSVVYSPKANISKKPYNNSTSRLSFASFTKRSGLIHTSFKPSPSVNELLENI